MSNLFRGLKPKTKVGRNGFDLSQKHVFTSRPGAIIPCLCLETVPGDHIEINVSDLTRTMTLNTAAFLRGKFNYDFYFVPYSQLWHPFNQFVDQRSDKHSSAQKGNLYCPTVSLSDVLYLVAKSLLGEDSVLVQNSDDVHGYNWGLNTLRLLDMLGYGSYYEILDVYDEDQALGEYLLRFDGIYVNVFRLAAYQHIWYDIYRNKYFDVESEYQYGLMQKHDYVRYFNFDDIDCTNLANSRIPVTVTGGNDSNNDRIFGLFAQRYVQYKKDLFTSLLPSTQFGAVSSIDIVNNPSYFTNDGGQTFASGAFTALGDRVTVSDSLSGGSAPADWHKSYANLNVPSAFDVLQLRKAELLQRWRQNALRAGNMVDDSFNAHFGRKPHFASDDNVMFLGSHNSKLQVNPVEATTPVNSKIGQLGATGTAVAAGEKIVFDLGKDEGDFGIIMAVCYFVPENEYNATGIDKANTLYEQFDFFTSEFENVGLEAVTRSQYDFATQPEKRNDVLGYAPRYWAYKTALDKVHGQFQDDRNFQTSLSYWVAPRHEIFFDLESAPLKIGTRSLSTFYVSPSQLNNIFGIAISPSDLQKQSQSNDPFYHQIFFDIKAIRPMSVLGLPQF